MNAGHETNSEKKWEHQKDEYMLMASYGESKKPNASPVITQLYEAQLQHDFYLTNTAHDSNGDPRYGGSRFFIVTDLYHNYSLGMKLEQAYGAGLAWGIQDSLRRQTFNVGADLRYIDETFFGGAKRLGTPASAFTESYSYSLPQLKIKKALIFSESGTVIPAYNDSHALQVGGIVKITLPLSKSFSIGPMLTDDYLRNAPPKSKQNYLSMTLSLSYAIGAAQAP